MDCGFKLLLVIITSEEPELINPYWIRNYVVQPMRRTLIIQKEKTIQLVLIMFLELKW